MYKGEIKIEQPGKVPERCTVELRMELEGNLSIYLNTAEVPSQDGLFRVPRSDLDVLIERAQYHQLKYNICAKSQHFYNTLRCTKRYPLEHSLRSRKG